LLYRAPMSSKNMERELGAISHLRPVMVGKALASTGNMADAEDLVQSAFERALRRRRGFRPDTDLAAWLTRVIRNLAIDQFRSPWRSRTVTKEVDEMAHIDPEPDHWWQDLDDKDIRGAISSCSDALREAFELHYYAGLSLAAISARMGVPLGTVATRIFRARSRVRATLQSKDPRS
jgi:RNA polymerase sigma-70 factor, ECF subfamily